MNDPGFGGVGKKCRGMRTDFQFLATFFCGNDKGQHSAGMFWLQIGKLGVNLFNENVFFSI